MHPNCQCLWRVSELSLAVRDSPVFPCTGHTSTFSIWRTRTWSNSNFEGTETLPCSSSTPSRAISSEAGRLHGSTTPPSWGLSIVDLLQQEGVEDDEEAGKVVLVTSYFIDQIHHQYHAEPRPLRFDEDIQDWENYIRFVWEDYVDPALPLDVVVVRPDPPRFAFRGASATVIVHEHPAPHRAACLISIVHVMDPVIRSEEAAHSVELIKSCKEQIILISYVNRVKGKGMVSVSILDISVFLLVNTSGLGLHVRVPPALSGEEAEQNFIRRIEQDQQLEPPHEWNPRPGLSPEADLPPTDGITGPEDEVSCMAGRPIRSYASSASSLGGSSTATTSSSSNAPDWRQTVLFVLDGPTVPARLPWHDQDDLVMQVAQALQETVGSILRIQYVSHRPQDVIQADLQCLVVQKAGDFRPSPYQRLVLF